MNGEDLSQKYRGKYRVASSRLQGYDYASNGAYFVTICTRNRECFLGTITDGKMNMSEIGEIVHEYWQCIPNHFPFVKLGEWIVMPNHIHGIIEINRTDFVETPNLVETPKLGVSTVGTISKLAKTPKLGVSTVVMGWKSGNLGVIINQYKRACTIKAREFLPDFAWQPRFYDRVVRNEREYDRIAEYITDNPKNWQQDKHFRERPN